jgi:mannose-6-phosphate isomerase
METISKRPWGTFEVLADASDHKVKRIIVLPRGKLSLQCHKSRNEHWYAVSGMGMASIDGKDIPLQAGCAVDIPAGIKHRVQNSADQDLVIIEVQTGVYFGEDDIERFEDDYGRI